MSNLLKVLSLSLITFISTLSCEAAVFNNYSCNDIEGEIEIGCKEDGFDAAKCKRLAKHVIRDCKNSK